ncbi:hypothetical protein NMG60_11037082 [Bertholletia excelsa]
MDSTVTNSHEVAKFFFLGAACLALLDVCLLLYYAIKSRINLHRSESTDDILYAESVVYVVSSAPSANRRPCPAKVVYKLYDEKTALGGCVICLEDFKVGDALGIVTHCDHGFHSQCINQWLYHGKYTCPVCRAVV